MVSDADQTDTTFKEQLRLIEERYDINQSERVEEIAEVVADLQD